MQNPRDDNTFDADFNICTGPYAKMLTDIITGLIMEGGGKQDQLTDFAGRFLEAVKVAQNVLSERTKECEREMQRYELMLRLEKIKRDEEELREEYRNKKILLEMLDHPKSPMSPNAPEDDDKVIV